MSLLKVSKQYHLDETLTIEAKTSNNIVSLFSIMYVFNSY